MGSKYSIVIEGGPSNTSDAPGDADWITYVQAAGSLKLVTAAIKEGLTEIQGVSGDITAAFEETETVNGQTVRTIARVTAEAEDVAAILNNRIKREKRDQATAATVDNGDGEDADQYADGQPAPLVAEKAQLDTNDSNY